MLIPLDGKDKSTNSRRLFVGRQAIQLAALIAAQLPENRAEALEIFENSMEILKRWLQLIG